MKYNPIFVIENSLTEAEAKCYVLRDPQQQIITHDNKHLFLSGENVLNSNEFEILVNEFHHYEVLTFKDVNRIREFSELYFVKPINLNLDFGEWGEFNLSNILEFCDEHILMPPARYFNSDVYPEALLDLGEFLEEDICVQTDSSVRFLISPPQSLSTYRNQILHLATAFEQREKAYLALELLKSNIMFKRIKDFIDDDARFYPDVSYVIEEGEVSGENDLLNSLNKIKKLALEKFTKLDTEGLYNIASDAVQKIFKTYEVKYTVEDSELWFQLIDTKIYSKIELELTDNYSFSTKISVCPTRSKLKLINKTSTSVTFQIMLFII